ncbi:flagella synthesis protein FlgN [Halopseudomonas xinjiangensis]|uniref:Flagella synthesis protein FlgN n=1 Tax=Halopseudomonas xinjiangensis TaxID=487184 RepID=A0A1H1YQI6_9GAMM|nr:flagellar export chaperone FlgN [Halopseudomonas xinjiangensis]SDT23610.1 flagella synthesis protein FlgN [Halopseudomonas xinjiangensis]
MNSRDRLLAALDQDIQQDLVSYRQLLALSQSLHVQLLQRDAQAVEDTNHAIAVLVEQASARAQRRSRILSAFSLKAEEQGMNILFASCGREVRDGLEAGWAQLGRLVDACRQQNDYNAQLLAMQHSILDHLLGQTAQADIYAPQYY